jgi:Protein of unknown function (DUF3999)
MKHSRSTIWSISLAKPQFSNAPNPVHAAPTELLPQGRSISINIALLTELCRGTLALVFLAFAGTANAIIPNEWRFQQTVDVPAAGLVRVNIPPETLDAARPGLEDLRILDATGGEVPYVIEHPTPATSSTFRPKEFHAEMAPAATVLTIVTGTTLPLRGVRIEAPGTSEFIKGVKIEGSHDGRKWRELRDRQPIFRMPGGATNLQISFIQGAWEFLRVTIDDSKTAQVPFTGALLEAGGNESPVEALAVTVKSWDESLGVTRIALDLGATNLTPAFLRLETPERLFTRVVTVAVPVVAKDDIAEQPIARAVIYRVDLNGKNESHLDIPIDRQVQSRQLLLLIANGDSPPLAFNEFNGQRRLVQVTFLAKEPGRYLLLSGNKQCALPNYDLSSLAADVKQAAATEIRPSPLVAMPDYKPADNLAAIAWQGAKIDVAPWKFRKHLDVSGSGARQVELDTDVLAGATHDLRDVRLVRDGKQIPFLLERTSILRAVPLPDKAETDKDRPALSRWSLKLPKAGLPLTRIVCSAAPGIFQRDFRLFENIVTERGDSYARQLVSANWRQIPGEKRRDFVLELNTGPTTDTLTLETDNGDNPPIELSAFRAYYPVTRMVFAATNDSTEPVWLYYGNPDAPAPRYDVNLVAAQLLGAERESAAVGPEEAFNSTAGQVGAALTGAKRYIFWGVLALAVITLLLLISRLLPKAEQ